MNFFYNLFYRDKINRDIIFRSHLEYMELMLDKYIKCNKIDDFFDITTDLIVYRFNIDHDKVSTKYFLFYTDLINTFSKKLLVLKYTDTKYNKFDIDNNIDQYFKKLNDSVMKTNGSVLFKKILEKNITKYNKLNKNELKEMFNLLTNKKESMKNDFKNYKK